MRRLARKKWPLVGYLVLAAGIVVAFSWSEMRYETLRRITGDQVCRQVSQAEAFKPTKDIPRSLIDDSIRSLQQERAELGLSPCPRKKEHQ